MAVPARTGTGENRKVTDGHPRSETEASEQRLRSGKSRYQVDLPTYHADCDANYLRLCKLMPELASKQCWSYRMPRGTFRVSVLERSRYTTEVCLQACAESGDNDWLAPPPITVRLYHDARMAEVVAVDGRGPVGGDGLNFSYPNPAMHGEDERQQVNRYLSEWLAHCLANGQAEVGFVVGGRRI